MRLYAKSNDCGVGLHLCIAFSSSSLLRQCKYDSYPTSIFRKHGEEIGEVKMGRFLEDNSEPMEATLFENLKLSQLY